MKYRRTGLKLTNPTSSARRNGGNGRSLFAQIADRVGVTPATVTLAMQDSESISAETKERVFWASRQLGYRRSRIKEQHHLNVAVIVGTSGGESLLASGNVDMWEGLSQFAEEHEISLHTFLLQAKDHHLDFEDLPNLLRRDQIDGVVILGWAFPSLLALLRKARVPTVVASNQNVPKTVDQVRIDMAEGGAALTKCLIERGHHRLGFLCGGRDLPVHQQLYSGYEKVMREHNLFDPALVRLCEEAIVSGIHPADELLRLNPCPTAILTIAWQTACQVTFAAIDARIPFDSGFEIGVCGDPVNLDYVYPVIRLNAHSDDVGRAAFVRLMEIYNDVRCKPKVSTVYCTVDLPQKDGPRPA